MTSIGIDPAQSEFGDETAIAVADENGIRKVEGQVGMSQTQIAGRAKQLAREYKAEVIAIDTGGGYGGGVADMLEEDEEVRAGTKVMRVLFGESSSDKTKWVNRKAELYWLFKEQIEKNPKYRIPNDKLLIHQASEVRIKPNSRGQDCAESKEEYAKRNNGTSPDRFEACALANYGATRHSEAAIASVYFEDYKKQEALDKLRIAGAKMSFDFDITSGRFAPHDDYSWAR